MIKFIENGALFDNQNINFIYGLAGNPAHIGHIEVIKELLKVKGANIHIVLSKRHAFGKKLLSYSDRKYILNSLLKDHFNSKDMKRIITNDVELLIEKDEPIYSYDLMNYYLKNYKGYRFAWVFGEDNCSDEMIKKFKNYEDIIKWEILKIKETLFIRSTDIRNYLKKNDIESLDKIYNKNIVKFLIEKRDEDDYWI